MQFRPDGFTLNNLKVYMGGDQFIDKALMLWELLVARAKLESVSRVALRYIKPFGATSHRRRRVHPVSHIPPRPTHRRAPDGQSVSFAYCGTR